MTISIIQEKERIRKMRNKYQIVYEWSLGNCLDAIVEKYGGDENLWEAAKKVNEAIGQIRLTLNAGDDEAAKMVSDLIYLRCFHCNAVITDDPYPLPMDVQRFFLWYYAVIVATAPAYATRLHLFDEQRGHLMDPVKGNTVNKRWYNDTPATAQDSEPLDHLASFSKESSETSSDMNTVASRLAEIDGSIRNVLEEWSSEIIEKMELEH